MDGNDLIMFLYFLSKELITAQSREVIDFDLSQKYLNTFNCQRQKVVQ